MFNNLTAIKIIFWSSLSVLFYVYFGYPLLLWIAAKMSGRPVDKRRITPRVSVIVVVHNEERYIEGKIKNILELDYPENKLEIIIGSDGSTDNTNKIIESYESKGIKPYISAEHVGKVNVLNEAVKKAAGEILVFSDVRQELRSDALRELVANFSDASVGCVSGELVFRGEDKNGVSRGIGFYWRYEKWIRSLESAIGSMVGATGAIYAVRKSLFTPPPPDTILDDVFIPLKIVEKGFRAVFDKQALAYDNVASASGEEFKRKARTLAGNFQLFMQFRNLFNPFRSKIAWQLFSHKFLRAVAFLFLSSMLISNLFLSTRFPYNVLLILQANFYILALLGLLVERLNIKSKIFSFPYVFCVLNLAALQGFFRFLFRKQQVRWEKANG